MKKYLDIEILNPFIKKYKYLLIIGSIGMLGAAALTAPIPYIIGIILDNIVDSKVEVKKIICILINLAFIYTLKFLISMGYQYFFTKAQQNIVKDIKLLLYKKIIGASLEDINKYDKGYILGRISEAQQVGAIFSPTLLNCFTGAFEMIFCLIVMFSINIKMSVISLLFLPIYAVISSMFSLRITRYTNKVNEDAANLNSVTFETLNGIEEIKILNIKKRQIEKIEAKMKMLYNSSLKQNFSMVGFIQGVMFLGDAISITILALACFMILSGEISIGVYTAFSMYISKMLGVTQSVGTFQMVLKPVCVAASRIRTILEMKQEEEGKKKHFLENIDLIKFDNVEFSYGNKAVLQNINLAITKGDRILIRGKNGSGKTTLIKLLGGLYEPQNGEISINSKSYNSLCKDDVRAHIGIVSQNIFLFRGTVLDNILLSNPGKSEMDVKKLIKELEVQDYFEKFPNGLNTEILQNGVGVSGGQTQMIAFLRAVLDKNDLLILDEGTTNLDKKTSEKIINILSRYDLYNMLIVISHENKEYDFINRTIEL